ncbi:hypothetical protein BDQ12DRAFT_642091 [Crucibulum laeve]|uniref:Uncharacterized protein n=1 Tax=Crucibulum laeve TaxID=68775 RepID=A0A5C3MJB7_9AGAR|nr:hypothetical protein BDQ12DRAFT_642091 [Crucibulum laeve]
MSHTSPATYLVWSLISSILGIFLLFHLWSFDRFKCLRWHSGPSSGAFKRVMTYSYLLSVPLIIGYAVGNAIIKYHEGFIYLPTHGVIPKPSTMWSASEQAAIFPLTLMFSIAWSLEMVTHLEELCFWLFLVNSGSAQRDWFKSLYFKTWMLGSVVAVIYMPLITILTRNDHLKGEAYTFLAGSLGSLSLTLWFTPILWTFPSFLKNLRSEGVDIGTIVRLTKFSELNLIRVIFRFLFCVPLLILGVDGVRPHTHVNESMFATDLLAVVAAIGVSISSGITLVIFFPRSIEGEIATRDAAKERRRNRSFGRASSFLDSHVTDRAHMSQSYLEAGSMGGTYLLTSSPMKNNFDLHSFEGHEDLSQGDGSPSMDKWTDGELRDTPTALPPIRPNRRRGHGIELGGIEGLTESNLSMHNMRLSNVNPMVHNFTSPIDLAYGQPSNESRLTFSRR